MEPLSLVPHPTPGAMFGSPEALRRLEEVSASRGDDAIGRRITELRTWIEGDLADVESALASLDLAGTPMHASARHLLSLGGKRLLQKAEGYDYTIKSGQVTFRNGEYLGVHPGVVLRGPQTTELAMAAE